MLLVSGIWLARFYLRYIGQHDYGLWIVGTQLLVYLTLTDFGVVELLPQQIAYATGRAGGQAVGHELQQLVGQTVRLVMMQLPAVIAIATAMFFMIPAEWRGLRGPLGLILAGFVLSFPLRIIPAMLQGLQDLGFLGKVQLISWFLTTCATVLMVYAGWGLFALALGWLVGQMIATPVFIIRIRRHFPGVVPKGLPPLNWPRTREQLGKGMWLCVSQIAQPLVAGSDLLIIGKLFGPAAVVPYACTGKVIGVLANQAQILMQTATPGLCEMKTAESRSRILGVLVALTHGILTFSGLVFCGVAIINQWFVTWWVGSKQWGGLTLTITLAVAMLFRHWTTTTAYGVFCFGYQRRISLTNLIDGAITASVCFVLTMQFGVVGAAAASLVGAILVSLPANLSIIAQDVGISIWELIHDMVTSFLWRFLAVGGAAVLIGSKWTPSSLPVAIFTALAITLVYSAVMLPNILRSPLGNYVRPVLSSLRLKFTNAPVSLSHEQS